MAVNVLRANTHYVSQEIYLISKNMNIHHHLHKRPRLHSLLSQINPVPTPHFLKIHLNNILPRYSKQFPTSSYLDYTYFDTNNGGEIQKENNE